MDDRETRPPVAAPTVWFLGDLDDPWVVAIADALPEGSAARVHCPGDLTEPPAGGTPGVVVVHRMVLTRRDSAFLARLKGRPDPPARVVLCFGPHVRYAEAEGWPELVDAALPDATARETIARHVDPSAGRRPQVGPRPRVSVVSTNGALRRMLAEACEAAGYPASAARDWSDAPAIGPAVWDLPVLDPDWPQDLARRARHGPVIALMGFADRRLVSEAHARGASTCLELPVDLADLAAALDRLPPPRAEPAHQVPPAPASHRRTSVAPQPVAGAKRAS